MLIEVLTMNELKFSPPDISDEEINEVIDTLKSGWITTGPKTKLFETKIAEYCGTEKAVCLNSATAGLELILRILGIGPGDEVIAPAYTYTASASVIDHLGAKIVLIDCSKDSYEMDYEKVAASLTPKTKAIIAVDLAGIIADYASLFKIAEENKKLFYPTNDIQKAFGRVIIIADAAHSFGAVQNGKHSGSIADLTSFSFHAVKNLTTAEGGAITWRQIPGMDSEDIYKEFMLWALHGQNKDALAKTKLGSWEYDISMLGYKYNMTDIMASIGLVQLKRYENLLSKRHSIIQKYNNGFKDLNVELLTHEGQTFKSSGHLYLLRLVGKNVSFRNTIIEKLAEIGIPTNVHYKPLPMMTAYQKLGFKIDDFPNAYAHYQNEITLPLHTLLDDEQIDYIITSFRHILQES